MKITTIGVLLLTATLTLLGCSDPAGPEVVGEVIFGDLTIGPDGAFLGDGVIFPSIDEVDVGEILMEREGRTIEVRGTRWALCGCTNIGVVELHKNLLTVSITNLLNRGEHLPFPVAFRARMSDLEPGSYEVRVGFTGFGDDGVAFTETAVID